MDNLRIGDKVVAITNSHSQSAQKRNKGNIYTIHDIIKCSCCGKILINVGGVYNKPTISCICGNIFETNMLGWTNTDHFIKYIKSVSFKEFIRNSCYDVADNKILCLNSKEIIIATYNYYYTTIDLSLSDYLQKISYDKLERICNSICVGKFESEDPYFKLYITKYMITNELKYITDNIKKGIFTSENWLLSFQ